MIQVNNLGMTLASKKTVQKVRLLSGNQENLNTGDQKEDLQKRTVCLPNGGGGENVLSNLVHSSICQNVLPGSGHINPTHTTLFIGDNQ